MKCLIVLILLVPYVFSRDQPTEGLTLDDLKQLEYYAQLTAKLEKEGKPYVPEILPQSLAAEEYSIYVYNRANTNGSRVILNQASKLIDVSSFDTKLKTVIYTHGWRSRYNAEDTQQIRDALLKAVDINVLITDWDGCAYSIYAISCVCTYNVGDFIGEFLTTVQNTYQYPFSDFTLVGHSLGAHISGFAGKYTNGSLPLIVALDAAAPLFFRALPLLRINATDAQFVHAIHTCSQFFGVSYDIGVADYWPNGGYRQAGCGITFAVCSHVRAIEFYIEAISENKFLARNCDSYENFEAGNCSGNPTSFMVGLSIDTNASGDYYLSTNADSPYGTGTA